MWVASCRVEKKIEKISRLDRSSTADFDDDHDVVRDGARARVRSEWGAWGWGWEAQTTWFDAWSAAETAPGAGT